MQSYFWRLKIYLRQNPHISVDIERVYVVDKISGIFKNFDVDICHFIQLQISIFVFSIITKTWNI